MNHRHEPWTTLKSEPEMIAMQYCVAEISF